MPVWMNWLIPAQCWWWQIQISSAYRLLWVSSLCSPALLLCERAGFSINRNVGSWSKFLIESLTIMSSPLYGSRTILTQKSCGIQRKSSFSDRLLIRSPSCCSVKKGYFMFVYLLHRSINPLFFSHCLKWSQSYLAAWFKSKWEKILHLQ